MSSMISCPSSWCESIIFGCRVLYGRACAFSNLPPTTISQLSILGSKDLILLCLCTCWPFSRYLISSPIDSTCALFTSWFWAVLSYVAIVWRSSFFTRAFFANRIAYSSILLSLARDEYLFHPNTGSVSWETPTHLSLFLSLFASSSGA